MYTDFMKKPGLYLDTTVPSAYIDGRTPDRQQLTQLFWESRLPYYTTLISEITLQEIRDTPDADRRNAMENLLRDFQVLPVTDEALILSAEYVERGIFPRKFAADADHVAIAVVHGLGYFASWNYKHLVKVATRREINLLNALSGYGPIEIVTPPEL